MSPKFFCLSLLFAFQVDAAAPMLAMSKVTPTQIQTIVQHWQDQAQNGQIALEGVEQDAFVVKSERLLKRLKDLEDWYVLRPNQRIEIANMYEELRIAADPKAAPSQRVCTREKRVGSNFSTTICMSAQEAEEQRLANRRSVDSIRAQRDKLVEPGN